MAPEQPVNPTEFPRVIIEVRGDQLVVSSITPALGQKTESSYELERFVMSRQGLASTLGPVQIHVGSVKSLSYTAMQALLETALAVVLSNKDLPSMLQSLVPPEHALAVQAREIEAQVTRFLEAIGPHAPKSPG